jgi:hypothetical protein
MNEAAEKEFSRQCHELGMKIHKTFLGYDKAVVICTLPGVLAAVSKLLGIPRDSVVAMLDSTLEDMQEK